MGRKRTTTSGRLWKSLPRPSENSASPPSGWTECAKVTRPFDLDMVGSLRGDMDTLLVFASLFSAVVTAFVIDSYHGLSGVSSVDTAALFQQLLLQMKEDIPVIGTASSASPAPVASTSTVCINALWFSSLVLSLNTVLGAILAKQWLSEYELVTCSTSKSPQEQVPLRQLKFDSLGRWRVTTIIDYLPLQLIFALFLFFAGLVYLVWTLNATVAIITSVWVALSALCFLSTTFLPSFFDLCAFCSPQSWFFFYLSKQIRRVFSKSQASEVYSFTDTWIDAFSDVLSRPSESRIYKIRALNWIHAILGSWESSLVPSLYRCVDSLPSSDAAKVICDFWNTGSSPGLSIAQGQNRATRLWTTIGRESYWRLCTILLESIQSRKGYSSADEMPSIMVLCSLHLVLCQEPSVDVEPQAFLPGLTQLAKILLGRELSIPLDTQLSVAATLSHISAHAHLTGPVDEISLSSFTEALTPDPSHQKPPTFLPLSAICIRLWSLPTGWHETKVASTHLPQLLSAMQSVVRSGDSSVGAAITHWMLFAIDGKFVQRMVNMGDKDVLGALQELALCFRKAYDEGLGLADSVGERIDVLIVSIFPPEAVCKTLSSARWSGNEPFSEANMRWWADRLGQSKGRVFHLLCDHSPLLNPSLAPGPAEIAHVRLICQAALVWEESWVDEHFLFRALPLVMSCCTLSEPDLSLWFPAMTSLHIFLAKVFGEIIKQMNKYHVLGNREDMLLLASVMRCAVGQLPGTASEDPILFISLVSGSLDLAAHCTLTDLELVAEFDDLLDAAASFVQLHNAHDAHAHNTTIRQWLVKLSFLKKSPFISLMISPERAELLIHAARDGNSIEGLTDIETLSQLDWAE
ncbi:hypothetical protein FB451DRAFT_1554801 [Mycena latifolia]|nr:hypothetical protein FB451DRAFT_1554801 [Mycena latifolia]